MNICAKREHLVKGVIIGAKYVCVCVCVHFISAMGFLMAFSAEVGTAVLSGCQFVAVD